MRVLFGMLLLAAALAAATPAGAVTVTEFPIDGNGPPTPHEPFYIATAPDGTLWFTDTAGSGSVRQMGLHGEPLAGIDAAEPVNLGFDSAGNLWWVQGSTDVHSHAIGRRTPSGSVDVSKNNGYGYALGFSAAGRIRWSAPLSGGSWAVCSFASDDDQLGDAGCAEVVNGSRITALTLGSDGRLWAVAPEAAKMFRLDANGEFPDPPLVAFPAGSSPTRAALGPDGNLWVATFSSDRIYRVTPDGGKTFFQLPAGQGPNDIILGPDGALWFTEFSSNSIGRLTTGLAYTSYPVPTPDARPYALTVGGDGALWFTEGNTAKIGRLELDRPPGGGGGGGGGGATDTLAPLFLRKLTFVPARFRRSSGSSIRFILSEPATVTIAIRRRSKGRRVNGSCLPATRARRHRRRCTRYVLAGTLTRKAIQGPAALPFSGRVAGHDLRRGRYRATARARDAAGNRSKPSVAGFTIAGR